MKRLKNNERWCPVMATFKLFLVFLIGILSKLVRIMHLVLLVHSTGLDAKFEPKLGIECLMRLNL